MKSSIQYLMAGIPVVSTPSTGGRDYFYEDDYALIVDPTPEAVAAGVSELIRREISPSLVRSRVMVIVTQERSNLARFVNDIYRSEGIDRDFTLEWPRVFRNYLLDADTPWQEVVRRIEQSDSRRQDE